MISALAVLPLEVYIIRDISQLYGIDYVVNLPREVLFGALMLIGLLKINLKDKDIFDKKKDEDEDEYGIMAGVKSFIKVILFVVVLLMSWLVAYIVHAVNHF
jgi:hypothetical protein